MKPSPAAAAIILLAGMPARAHRLDEYLQGTLISVDKTRLEAQISLTPGVAVFPFVLAGIDIDGDGFISGAEQRAYASRVLRDLSLSIDGQRLTLHFVAAQFPAIQDMQEGLGAIRIDFAADLPPGGPNRRLVFENHHQSRIAAYQVNCLVPRDPDIRIVAQNRNYSQSLYRLDYTQAGDRPGAFSVAWRPGDRAGLGALALFFFARLAIIWRRAGVRRQKTEFRSQNESARLARVYPDF
jgi:hypothetical protein